MRERWNGVAPHGSERRSRFAEQARVTLVESEPDGLTGFRVEIALALDDQLTGRRIDVEDCRIAEIFEDLSGLQPCFSCM